MSKGEQCHTVRTPVPALFLRPRAEVRSAYSSLHCSFSLLIFQAFAQDNIFITPPQFLAAVGPVAVGTGDFNGDGKLNLAVLNGCPAAGCGISGFVRRLEEFYRDELGHTGRDLYGHDHQKFHYPTHGFFDRERAITDRFTFWK